MSSSDCNIAARPAEVRGAGGRETSTRRDVRPIARN
jgi:hypothetical protein